MFEYTSPLQPDSGSRAETFQEGRRRCIKMIVDLLLLCLSIVVFLYDFLTFPIYWLVQQPWKQWWESLLNPAWRSTLFCRCHALLSQPIWDRDMAEASLTSVTQLLCKNARVKLSCTSVKFWLRSLHFIWPCHRNINQMLHLKYLGFPAFKWTMQNKITGQRCIYVVLAVSIPIPNPIPAEFCNI